MSVILAQLEKKLLMKTYLISRMVMPCVMVCCVTTGFSQDSPIHPENYSQRNNITGYGTTIIHYHLDGSQRISDEKMLKNYLQQFEGIKQVAIHSDDIQISFDDIKNVGQVDLLFERVEMLYLTTNKL